MRHIKDTFPAASNLGSRGNLKLPEASLALFKFGITENVDESFVSFKRLYLSTFDQNEVYSPTFNSCRRTRTSQSSFSDEDNRNFSREYTQRSKYLLRG